MAGQPFNQQQYLASNPEEVVNWDNSVFGDEKLTGDLQIMDQGGIPMKNAGARRQGAADPRNNPSGGLPWMQPNQVQLSQLQAQYPQTHYQGQMAMASQPQGPVQPQYTQLQHVPPVSAYRPIRTDQVPVVGYRPDQSPVGQTTGLRRPMQSLSRPPRRPEVLQDKTNRVQKPQKHPQTPATTISISNLSGERLRSFMGLCRDFGKFEDGQHIELDFDHLSTWFTHTKPKSVKSEAMSRETTGVRRHIRSSGSRSIPDTPTSAQGPRTSTSRERQRIAKLYRGWQRAFRLSDKDKTAKYKCTMGCPWTHKMKSNWERHEKTHYPQEIWICFHKDCMEKSLKTRVSFRKDLARRHHVEHHKDDAELSDRQLDDLKVDVEGSLFPKECVFQGCDATFETFQDRSSHIEAHLKHADTMIPERIKKFYPDREVNDDDDAEHETDFEFRDDQQSPQDTNDGNDDNDDDDEDPDDSPDMGGPFVRRKDQDPDAGASGGGSNMQDGGFLMGTGAFAGSAFGSSAHQNINYGTQGYNHACDFDTFGGNGFMPSVDSRPWKKLNSLRLQLLPQVFARGIAQTPLVLKKIQLQATLALEASGVKKIQVAKILRREIAMMATALPASSGPFISGLPSSFAMTRLLPNLGKSVTSLGASTFVFQDHAMTKFSGLEDDVLSEKADWLIDKDGLFDDPLYDRLTQFSGGHICRCLPIRSNLDPIRPSRLIHVGSKVEPKLHLDTLNSLPSKLDYCSLTHCWDDGYGLSLLKDNAASLQQHIPPDRLTRTFHLAVDIARDKGVEYLWIDTLCIMQDSYEDLEAEAPRITQIHASATFAITITSLAYDKDAKIQPVSRISNQQVSQSLSGEPSVIDSASDTPELTLGNTVETSIAASSRTSLEHEVEYEPKMFNVVSSRRDSHQLETFLAEPQKRSLFLPIFSSGWASRTSSPVLAPISLDTDIPEKGLDAETLSPYYKKSYSKISSYLDAWQKRWHKLSSRSTSNSIVISPESSPAPSIAAVSLYSAKRKPLLHFPVTFEKLFRGFRRKGVGDAIGDDDGY